MKYQTKIGEKKPKMKENSKEQTLNEQIETTAKCAFSDFIDRDLPSNGFAFKLLPQSIFLHSAQTIRKKPSC
jgi:hypothetical protein